MNSYHPRQSRYRPPRLPCQIIPCGDISSSNITLFHESLSNSTMRGTWARPPRALVEILTNPLVFQQFQHPTSTKPMKTYDFLIQKSWKIGPRAQAESFKNQWFFNIPVKWGFAGNFCAHLELLQQRLRACQGHNPCQIIPCGAHARGRRARMSKSSRNHVFFNSFKIRFQ